MRRRLMLKSSAGVSPVLPAEYQRVEWIGTNVRAYINTGISVMDGTITEIEFITDISNLSYTDSYVMIHFGTYFGQFLAKNSNSRSLGLTPSASFSFNAAYYQQKRLLKIRWDELNTSAEIGSEVIQHTRTEPASHGSLILGSNLSGPILTLNAQIYSCVNRGNNITQILIPCYRKSDRVIGMYDTVSKSFFTNAGTGTFTKGADV